MVQLTASNYSRDAFPSAFGDTMGLDVVAISGLLSTSNRPFMVVQIILLGPGQRLCWLLLRQWYAQTRIIVIILSLICNLFF